MIYTSGSTGKPKGVMIGHSSLVNYLQNDKTGYINPDKKTSGSFIHLSYTFDASLTAIFMPLLSGKLAVLSSKNSLEVLEDPNLLKYAPYDFIKITPAHIDLIHLKLKDANGEYLTQKLVIGGEALLGGHFSHFMEEGIAIEIVNEYGPTEATVGCSTFSFSPLTPQEKITRSISIGKPINNAQIYILGSSREPVPIGVPGEIYIGGAGLSRGYLNRPELTKEKFVSDPFSKEKGARLYRTGDLGRWLADGNIEYWGRTDDQVKIRGYRIELGEIESVLGQSEQVSQAIVAVRADKQGNKQLVGYVVPEGEYDRNNIQAYLKQQLPDYMIPAHLVAMESFPLTANGKIDRKALPDPELPDMAVEYVAPRNETEQALARIWQELLGIERVGVYDNFFELGGHSLLAMRVVSYIERDLSVTIPINMLFQFASIGDLSKYLEIQNIGDLQERNADIFKVIDV